MALVALSAWLINDPTPPATQHAMLVNLGSAQPLPAPQQPSAANAEPSAQSQAHQQQPPLALPNLQVPPLQHSLTVPSISNAYRLAVTDWNTSLPNVPDATALSSAPLAPVSSREIAHSVGNRKASILVAPVWDEFYPRRARRRGIEGETEVEVTIDTSGTVIDVTIITSTPPGVFDEAVRRAMSHVVYQPATQDGQPVTSTKRETFRWTLP